VAAEKAKKDGYLHRNLETSIPELQMTLPESALTPAAQL
jgi:hypothetical protein